MSSDRRRKLSERILASKEFRDNLTDAEITNRISFQLKSMQADRGWTQQELAERAGIAQPLISKYLSGYGSYSLRTLRKLASAFDVNLVAGFEPYSVLVDWMMGLSPEKLAVPPVERDAGLRYEVNQGTHPYIAETYEFEQSDDATFMVSTHLGNEPVSGMGTIIVGDEPVSGMGTIIVGNIPSSIEPMSGVIVVGNTPNSTPGGNVVDITKVRAARLSQMGDEPPMAVEVSYAR